MAVATLAVPSGQPDLFANVFTVKLEELVYLCWPGALNLVRHRYSLFSLLGRDFPDAVSAETWLARERILKLSPNKVKGLAVKTAWELLVRK